MIQVHILWNAPQKSPINGKGRMCVPLVSVRSQKAGRGAFW